MKITPIVTALLSLGLLSATANAASIDFRHQYNSESKNHSSRVKMGNTFDNNFSVSLEVKFKGEDPTDFMKGLQNNGTEIGLGYTYKLSDQWALQPGMPIEFRDSGTTFKPQLRLTYTPASIDGLSLSGRYRLDVKNGAPDYEKYRHRGTFNAGYKMDQWKFGYEFNYYYADDAQYTLYDNGRTNYDHNVTAHYSMGDWTPWVELGDVSVGKETSKRELRSRVGIAYKF
ncbi:N-acetylneuraminic acid outer membrane channel protein NanC [Alginatibacterium sediminis]|uniref:N-acetylneuraminic acid outer membrane channel protein NanC n=1 Tax=Alginatibacterium sediminis TaxID=2164068 RepID=A0A420EBV9_9ALTE|nr:oligogalacturonate-specific porin KdgM family protein [Alginatibacterium sediminis]RKF18168.1 N-acetylneuraminic acid outer membrane channel protein NanC [Alginatibacterium sediminis]